MITQITRLSQGRVWTGLLVGVCLGMIPMAAAKAQIPDNPLEERPRTAPPVRQKPVYKYPVEPRHGPWLVCVKSYKGDNSQANAESLAEYIQKSCGLQAYIFDWGWKQYQEERLRVKTEQEKRLAYFKEQGYDLNQIQPGMMFVRSVKILDEFAVLVAPKRGELKDLEAASEFLKTVRSLKAPPAELSDTLLVGNDDDEANPQKAAINPFHTAIAVTNPTIPKVKDDGTKLDPLIWEINSGRPYNLLKCSKPWTMVVRVYSGTSVMQPKERSVMDRLWSSRKPGEGLEACAQQAEKLAEVLRKGKPSFEAYVMHTRYQSIVCVGQYDTLEDPQFEANQKALGGLQLKTRGGEGDVIDSLLAKPMPMPIPKKK